MVAVGDILLLDDTFDLLLCNLFEGTTVQEEEAVGMADAEAKVVGGHYYRLFLVVGQLTEETHRLSLRRVIEKSRGLVKDHHRCYDCIGQLRIAEE